MDTCVTVLQIMLDLPAIMVSEIFFKCTIIFCYYCSLDISFTLSGDASYIQVSVNSLLLDLSDQGVLLFRTIDTSAILLYAVWYNNYIPTYDYLTVEIVQGYIQLNTYIPEGMHDSSSWWQSSILTVSFSYRAQVTKPLIVCERW